MKPYITFKSSIVVFLLILIFSGLCLLVLLDDNEDRKFLYIPFIIGIGICLISSYVKITDKIKVIEDELKITNSQKNVKHVNLTTCPEYWKKKIVKNSSDNKEYMMCYNKINNNGDTIGKFDKNEFTDDNIMFINPANDYQIDDLTKANASNAQFHLQNSDPIQEGFVNPPEGYHKHYVNTVTTPSIILPDGTTNDNGHIHTYESMYTYYHKDGSTDIVRGGNLQDNSNKYYNDIYSNNFDNWFNDFTPENAGENETEAEINVTKLNTIKDNCLLTKPFAWIEAHNKCNKANI